MVPHRGILHVCVLQVAGEEPCPGVSYARCLLNPLLLGAAGGSCCCRECAGLSVPPLQISFLVVSAVLMLLCSSPQSLVGFSDRSCQCSCSLAAPMAAVRAGSVCAPRALQAGSARCSCRQSLAGHAGCCSPRAAHGLRVCEKRSWHRSLHSFLKPGHLSETKLPGVSDEELSGAD